MASELWMLMMHKTNISCKIYSVNELGEIEGEGWIVQEKDWRTLGPKLGQL